MTGTDIALYIGGSLLVYWVVSVLLDDGGPAARRRREGGAPPPRDAQAAGADAGGNARSALAAAPSPVAEPSPVASPPAAVGVAAGEAGPPVPSWHEVLGVPAEADTARILAAYRELMMREHPDPRTALTAEEHARIEARLEQIEAACNAGLAARRS